MTILDLIEKKKLNQPLNFREYKFFVDNFTKGLIPDYQASSLLMAIRLMGTNSDENYYLTKAMLESGTILKPIATNKLHILIDKHSSGGVGDKVSLILSPILVELGYDVAKLSGRGLAFTGGTIDKLESIGVDCVYSETEYQHQLEKNHMFLMMQGQDIVPADKKMYALRDVTGTVDSIALMASSIMSKKLAIETNYIFLDIKVGNGAFCKDLDMAILLANKILEISEKFNRKTIIHLTQMSTPLGRYVGNRMEVKETLDFLQNNIESENLKDLIYNFVADILMDTNVLNSKELAFKKIDEILDNHSAFNRFIEYVKNQSGDYLSLVNNTYWNPKYKVEVKAPISGYLEFKSTSEVGMIAAKLGAGRFKKGDPLDFDAGIYLNKEDNSYVKEGEVVATLYSNKEISSDLVNDYLNNLIFNLEKKANKPIILKVMRN